MPSDLLELARLALEAFAPDPGREISERSEQSPPPAPVSSLSSLMSPPAAPAYRRRCWTCGEAAAGSFDDGSPRFSHGHDPGTGIRWTAPSRSFRFGSVRVCPGCGSGIAYLSVSDAAQARVAAADAMDRVMANRKIGG